MINKTPIKVFKTDKILAILSKKNFIKRAKDFWGDDIVCISIRNPEAEALDLDFFYQYFELPLPERRRFLTKNS